MKCFPAVALVWVGGLGGGAAATAQQAPSPYGTRFVVEAPITLGLAGRSATGLLLVRHQHVASAAELVALNRDTALAVDRFSAGHYSDRAQATSDGLCYGTRALVPALLAFDLNMHGRYGQVFDNFNPGSRAQPYVWGIAATVPASTFASGQTLSRRQPRGLRRGRHGGHGGTAPAP